MAATARTRPLVSYRAAAACGATLLVVAVYGYFAVFSQPLAAGGDALILAPGQTMTDTSTSPLPGMPDTPGRVVNYVDGETSILTADLVNSGNIPLTVTGIATSPDYYGGPVTLKDPRSAVFRGGSGCCALDENATWSAQSFRSFVLDPGRFGTVALHLFMTHCYGPDTGGYSPLDHITVYYTVLGFPHSEDVAIGPYLFLSPPLCMSPGSSPPPNNAG